MRIRKQALVMGHVWNGHGDTRSRWDYKLAIPKRLLKRPWISCTQSVPQSRRLRNASPQIRCALLQNNKIERSGATIGKQRHELAVQALVDAWRVDDVEGCDREGESGSFDPSAYDNLGLVCESAVCFIAFRERTVEDGLEYGLVIRRAGLDRIATEITPYCVPLVALELKEWFGGWLEPYRY